MDADLVASLPERYRGCPSFSFGDSPELANELAALVISGRKIATVNTLDAVSYTHLDVYKRQSPSLRWR